MLQIEKLSEADGSGALLRYGCSKWAVEVLLKELHARWGVPVKIFRCGMILSHTTYLGQINPTDFFTRLLCGIAYTGIAPESFYTLPHGPEEHFDGMPIDFVSGGALTPFLQLIRGALRFKLVGMCLEAPGLLWSEVFDLNINGQGLLNLTPRMFGQHVFNLGSPCNPSLSAGNRRICYLHHCNDIYYGPLQVSQLQPQPQSFTHPSVSDD